MALEQMKVRIKGTVPIMLHNIQLSIPTNPYAKLLASLTKKRGKTDQIFEEIARIEWEGGLYLRDGVVVIPARNFDRSLEEAAKKHRKGRSYKSGVIILEEFFPLDYVGPKIKISQSSGQIPNPELDKYFDRYKSQESVGVDRKRVLRTRPIFEGWSFEATICFDNTVIDDRDILSILSTAGQIIGLCEKRPRLGRFEFEKVE